MAEIEIQRGAGVLTLTLSRPETKNAVTLAMWARLAVLFREADEDPSVRVVVLKGAGGNFSSGADLAGQRASAKARPGDSSSEGRDSGASSDSTEQTTLELMRRRIAPTALALRGLTKPTIALVQGVAAGAGCNLALGCDLVYASEDARFSQIFVRRGLSLDFGGAWLLPRLVGLQKAKELALFGEFISARDALAAGLIAGVEAPELLEARGLERAGRLASQSPVAVSSIKRALDDALHLTFAESIDREFVLQARCIASDDFAEGVAAFLEKRPPNFQGR
jgi:enoyl-CoA hydratase/carnithine racemase